MARDALSLLAPTLATQATTEADPMPKNKNASVSLSRSDSRDLIFMLRVDSSMTKLCAGGS
jgi:hypothetical protein